LQYNIHTYYAYIIHIEGKREIFVLIFYQHGSLLIATAPLHSLDDSLSVIILLSFLVAGNDRY